VILEQTGQNWLFGLDYPITNQKGIGLTSDFTLRYWDTVNQRFTYQVHWLDDAPINLALSTQQRQVNLALPAGGNPQSRQFAQRLYHQAGDDPITYTNAIAQWMRSQQFRYTLSPPTLGNNHIDDFLFATRAGFCEHYASSFTYLMRAAGVPARVVAGYQGGRLGRDGKSWEVRQMDAHAWSEIWVQGRGWVRVDPTGFV
ncbi:transglutaminaseTgpA domain-containing protein, partial [Xanthomonas citri pv. citri]